ncbi:NAD(P)-dependent oxidoreductase [Sphingomonas sp.]|uniref:NAD-dependent epimerase/dehydratase family protein n=1 Tax=Sphingomonas sp. TaxID=28214 RepID=UPI001DE8BAB3|nr:NAD(P)-dependent oxidoreductase [Sphingomonas sp.]MBX9795998.1 NAD(P)-dependent oxidoreductase [Sphingomonas sp.]
MAVVWVTGGAGFIGSALLNLLSQQGHVVAGIGGAAPAGHAESSAAWAPGRIRMGGLDALAAQTGAPDYIHHLAGGSSVGVSIADPFADFEKTVAGSAILLEWMRQASPAASLVVASSAAVYGVGHDGAIPVTAAPKPCSPYGRHKQIMELMCRSYAESYGIRASIVRLFSVYGPGLRKQLLWDLCGKLSIQGSAVLGGTGDELRDWVHVDDVCRLLAKAADLASLDVPVINGGTGVATSVRDIAQMTARSFDLSDAAISFSGLCRAGDPFSLVAARPAEAFDWRHDLAQGIASYVAWFKRNNA